MQFRSAAFRWFVMQSSMSTTAAMLSTSNLYIPHASYFDISDVRHYSVAIKVDRGAYHSVKPPCKLLNELGLLRGTNPYQGFSRGFSPALHNRFYIL